MNNLLKKTRCYLVGHIEFEDGRGWRDIVTPRLEKMNITVFNPYEKPFLDPVQEDEEARKTLKENMLSGNFEAVAERMKRVRSDDLRCCDVSDFCFAKITPNVASWGSAEELVTFTRMKKPIFLVVEGGKRKTPLWVMGMFPHKYIYDSIEQACDMLEAIDRGDVMIDSDRWRLLKPQFR
jgi:hypothetical protein